LKTIAYLCSYEQNEEISAQQIAKQNAEVNSFCELHGLILDKVYTEESYRDDYKPVLLNIMSKSYKIVDKIIMTDTDVISRNKDFKDWVVDEFNRMGMEVICCGNEVNAEEDESLNKNISNITENIKNIPSLPEIITKSIEIMQDKNASAETLSKIISTDIGLTARVLKLVNSAYYGFPKQISTVKQAITILGFTTIKGIIISASVFKMFSENLNPSVFNYKQFWKHSLLTASASRMLCDEDSEDIFSAAFLHDIGKIILAKYDKDNYSKIYKFNCETEEEIMKMEEQFCGLNHCEIGNIVAYSWNLPEIFCEIITNHHNPEKSFKYAKECSIVFIANKIAEAIVSNKNLIIDNITSDLLEKINISEQNVISVYDELKEISLDFNDINSFFN